ncbi:MAG: alpha/beta hydrolase [Ferruginibacter sp.]|nr:alpha/beta hydrolase [Ferruginibacter sp.]
MRYLLISFFAVFTLSTTAQDSLNFSKTEVIYGRKDGMALTMTVLTPKQKANGKAIISVISGNWISAERSRLRFTEWTKIYVDNGYTVFGVMVGSQPRYTIPDEITDLKRAVRFIRYNAKEYKIDPEKIGITGSSSGGHLSLMIATASDSSNTKSTDPVDKASARVQAAAVFFPPTDFINYGGPNTSGKINQAGLVLARVAAAFDFKVWNDTTGTYVSITDTEKRLAIAKEISPINSVTPDDPPVMIVHGDKDMLVPKQQSESIIAKLKEANVPNNLIIKEGGGHGWKDMETEQKYFVDWFDKYLK